MRTVIITLFIALLLQANSKFKKYVDIGYTTQYITFKDNPDINNDTKNGINTEFGILKKTGVTGLFVGSAVDFTIIDGFNDFENSHSSINLDVLKIEQNFYNTAIRFGFGATRLIAKANATTWSSAIGINYRMDSLALGVKYRYAKMHVDNEKDAVVDKFVFYDVRGLTYFISYIF